MKNISYCKKRLNELKITDLENEILVFDYDVGNSYSSKFFVEDENDNIRINYFSPTAEVCKYATNGKLKNFSRLRLKEPNEKGKYSQPFKSGVFPFITKGIIEKVKSKTTIETLFVVEGEFKAFAGNKIGLDIVGIGGIQNYKDKENNKLHEFFYEILETCKVKNIVLLFDADCFDVEFQPEKDLYLRPNNFYSAVRNFKELTKPLNIDVYFSHILSKFSETSKGLDDLINNENTEIEILKFELKSFLVEKNRKYIYCVSISENSISELRKLFCIDNVDNFYYQYSKTIKDNEFVYNQIRFQYDVNEAKVKFLNHGDIVLFMRVGCDYFKTVYIEDGKGNITSNIKKWNIREIKRDYFKYNSDLFISQIPKYEAFCIKPDNSKNYKRIIELRKSERIFKNYNLYEPIDWELKEGNIDNILNFLKHITGNENLTGENKLGDKFTVMLDWLTILYQKPTEILPVPCLVSKENVTGKSTFLDLLKNIFKSNAVILGNNEFSMSFNSHYATKSLIMIDESQIALEAKAEKERIKRIATGKTMLLQFKGVDMQEISYYGKLVMCSNNEDNFMPLDKEDVRFWILKVPVLEKKDPKFLDKMIFEIPAFLHFLENREIFHPNEGRAWFLDKYIETEQKHKIVEYTKPQIDRDVEDFVKDMFLDYNFAEFKIDAKELTEKINQNSKYKHSKADYLKFLKNKKGMEASHKATRYKLPIENSLRMDNKDVIYFEESEKVGRPFTFIRSEWLIDEIIEDKKTENEPLEQQKNVEIETELRFN